MPSILYLIIFLSLFPAYVASSKDSKLPNISSRIQSDTINLELVSAENSMKRLLQSGSPSPTKQPSPSPTKQPSAAPTKQPSAAPTKQPSPSPTKQPSAAPTKQPSPSPTKQPSVAPTKQPSPSPSQQPSPSPTSPPSSSPTKQPSRTPSAQPSVLPTEEPSHIPTLHPSWSPSQIPTRIPTKMPSTLPSRSPTKRPSSQPSNSPTSDPTPSPSVLPTSMPSTEPTSKPSISPTSRPTVTPTHIPTAMPSIKPTISIKPSPSPTSKPSLSPTLSPTSQPSRVPSVSPTDVPSSSPSSSPSYSWQEFTLGILLSFDDLKDFSNDPYAKRGIQLILQTFVQGRLEKDIVSDRLEVTAEYIDQFPYVPTESGNNRRLQTSSSRSVSFNLFVRTRSATTYDKDSMSNLVEKTFDTQTERENFIFLLQDEDATFSRINTMLEVRVNDKLVVEKEPRSSSWVYIGSGIGAGFVGIAIMFFIIRRRRKRNAFEDADFYDAPSALDPRNSLEIEVVDDDYDVSTMGDPIYGGPTNIFGSFPVSTEDEPTNDSQISAGYDYKMAYGGAGDLPSVSSAGGTKSAHGTRALADDLTDGSRVRVSSIGSSKMSKIGDSPGDISLFDDDRSFERMYGEDERIEINAPAGKLGVVIDTPLNGVPMVHAIKDSSVLASRIRIGDKLVSVDGEDTTRMSAIKVSKLISSKAMNPRRRMVFMRSPHQ